MKGVTRILFAIAITLWVLGAILLYKRGTSNTALVVTAVIILMGFFWQVRKGRATAASK